MAPHWQIHSHLIRRTVAEPERSLAVISDSVIHDDRHGDCRGGMPRSTSAEGLGEGGDGFGSPAEKIGTPKPVEVPASGGQEVTAEEIPGDRVGGPGVA